MPPELNPDEKVWNHFKKILANGRPDTQDELLSEEICNLAESQPLLRSCIH